jgi:7-carboxy-7-deazaguanine synthase
MCNLRCAWCDTKYTWDASKHDLGRELKLMDYDEVAEAIDAISAPLLVITGGEPALQADGCTSVLSKLKTRPRVEVETSGTVWIGALADAAARVIVSPKLANSGVRTSARLRPTVLARFAGLNHAVFKFVVSGLEDLNEVSDVVSDLGLDSSRVWIMPEGTQAEILRERLAYLTRPVSARGWNLSSRLHVMLWGDQRGR